MREKNGDFHEILTIFILLNDISFINHLIDVLYIYCNFNFEQSSFAYFFMILSQSVHFIFNIYLIFLQIFLKYLFNVKLLNKY